MKAVRPLNCDVLVFGGGPSGSAAALELLGLGYDVVLVESSRQEQPLPCQSLPQSALPLLDRLGVVEELCACAVCHVAPMEVYWSGIEHARNERSERADETTILIDRAGFDMTLRERARMMGCTVLDDVRIASLQAVDGSHQIKTNAGAAPKAWNATLRASEQVFDVQARFAVIATGRLGVFGGRRRRRGPVTLAIAGIWRNQRGATWSVCEASAHAWYWAGALPDGRTSVIAMIDPGSPMLRKHSSLAAAYRELVAASMIIGGKLQGPLDASVHAMDASRQLTMPVASPVHLRIGDAAATLDPLSSQGLVVALNSAIQGAVAVHTILGRPENTGAAVAFCEQRQLEVIERDQRQAGLHYSRQATDTPTTFWRARAVTAPPELDRSKARDCFQSLGGDHRISLNRAARLQMTPALTAGFIEQTPALVHAALDRPIAFVGGTPVLQLMHPLLAGRVPSPDETGYSKASVALGLEIAPTELRIAELLSYWEAFLPVGQAIAFLDSLIARGIIVATTDTTYPEIRSARTAGPNEYL